MSAAAATPRRTRRTSYYDTVSHRRRAADLGVLSALFILALLGFQTVYGGVQYLLTGLMALLFGVLIALIGARWRWGPLRLALLVVGVYFLFGPMFAAPTHALFGIIPTPASLWELLKAPVTSWKSVLTVAPPVGTAQGVLAVVWISTLLLVLLGSSVVLRTRFYVPAWLFPLLLVGVTIVFGTDQSVLAVLRGVLYVVISVAWLTWRYEAARLASAESTIISDTVRPGSWQNPVLRRRVIGGAVIMAIAAGAAFAASPLLDPPPGTVRYALRDRIAPPFNPHEYVSPLSEFRGYLKDQREEELFSVTGVSEEQYIRLAAMDYYDLQVYNVASSTDPDSASGAFLRTAPGVDLHEGSDREQTATVTIGAYSGVWLPTLGTRTNRIDLEPMDPQRAAVTAENLYLNQKSDTAVNAAGVRPGDTYELSFEPYTEPGAEEMRTAKFADIALPENQPVEGFTSLAEEWAGSSDSDYEQVQNLLRAVKTDAFYSHGLEDDTASLSGHSVSRLLAMLEDFSFDKDTPDAQPLGRIGDEEQYAALVAALLRSIDVPARVVMGFQVPEGQEGTVALTGDDVTAWVEVAFQGVGWVRFDPAPDEDEDPTQPKPKEVEKPLPQVAQPPPPPAEPPTPPPGAMSEDSEKDDEELREFPSWAIYLGIGVLPLLVLLLAALGVVIAKSRRRTRRRTRGTLPDRVDGGWQEILDLITDHGRSPDRLATRAETAAGLQADLPQLGAMTLASRADRAVFGPDDLPEAAAEEYWSHVTEARRSMSAAAPWHKRLRAALSLRSFRHRAAHRRDQAKLSRDNARARKKAEQRKEALRRRRSSLRGTEKKPTSPRKGPTE